MRRRDAIGGLTLLVAGTWAAKLAAQQRPHVARIAVFTATHLDDPFTQSRLKALRAGLRELGWIEGQNLSIEMHVAEGRLDRLPLMAAELAQAPVDVIVTGGTDVVQAAEKATHTIPIVMGSAGDVVGAGVVASLAHPGGNVTGFTLLGPDLSGKRVEVLRDALPQIRSVAITWNPLNPGVALKFREIEAAAHALGIESRSVPVTNANEIEAGLNPAVLREVDAVVTTEDSVQIDNRASIIALAAKEGRPVAAEIPLLSQDGALMSYGADILDLWRRSAGYVDKILKGVKPEMLPVQEPNKYRLVINLKMAKVLGLNLSPSLVARADEVIE